MPGNCRFCHNNLKHIFVDLGMSPLSNSFLNTDELEKMEPFLPLKTYVCEKCKLVQLEEFEAPENIFSDYAYFSSYSDSWLKHAEQYTEMMVERFNINKSHKVIEIASNDGYLLQYFKEKEIPTLGIEPASNVAEVATKKGIDTIVDFFNSELAQDLSSKNKKGDLILGNNVLAHVPNLNDFVEGLKIVLSDKGIITMEFPHLLRLIEEQQFDTIYHEHFSYFSLATAILIFEKHGLKIFDVEELPTHGGSIRIFACHKEYKEHSMTENIEIILNKEESAGLTRLGTYQRFSKQVEKTKRLILSRLIAIKNQGKTICAYGAPAKGNTLLNYCGIGSDFIDYTVDRNPNKQNKYLPGTHIPIYSPDKIKETQPDYIIILPWNLSDEIKAQLSYTEEWGCKLIRSIPAAELIQ